MNKNIGIILSFLVLLAVAAGGYKSYREKHRLSIDAPLGLTPPASSPANSPNARSPASTVPSSPLKLITGSAKFAFLKDPELTQLLGQHGIRLELIKSGAFAADRQQAGQIDAAWPASAGAAADWAGALPGSNSYPVFSTPLALATWRALIPMLEQNGLVKMQGPNHGSFDLDKALPLMLKGTRWNQLPHNSVFNVNKGFLVNTPDLRHGVTSTLYLATLAYILNGHEVPQSQSRAEQLALQLLPLIARQGFQESTLAGPFEDYIGQGMGKAPLVLVYESQFFEARRDGKLQGNHLLLYPQPGLMLKHVLVAKTPAGKKLGELLANDPALQKIAARYGFRTNHPALFAFEAKRLGLDAPELINLADTPNASVLDAMTQTIINQMETK